MQDLRNRSAYKEKKFFRIYFLAAILACGALLGQSAFKAGVAAENHGRGDMPSAEKQSVGRSYVTLFMTGDVMTGRGIDQVLPHPADPVIYEGYMKSARGYVQIAEEANGPIPQPADFAYIWGDALEELKRRRPDLRLINLETSVTASDDYWKNKGINYRMHPQNIPILTRAGINFCSLANNHVLDWGYAGLLETLQTLKKANIFSTGAGRNLSEASAPAVMAIPGKGRVLMFSLGLASSGIPLDWAATAEKPGVNLLEDLSINTVRRISQMVQKIKQKNDIIVASIHWGSNWGYKIPTAQKTFAHRLIERAGVDIVHGHSSHHVKGIEVYQHKLILYGCGDFINDYEGIRGYEEYRGDLSLMYFVTIDPSNGKLVQLEMIPTQMRRFRVSRAANRDALWLKEILNREGKRLGTRVIQDQNNVLKIKWD